MSNAEPKIRVEWGCWRRDLERLKEIDGMMPGKTWSSDEWHEQAQAPNGVTLVAVNSERVVVGFVAYQLFRYYTRIVRMGIVEGGNHDLVARHLLDALKGKLSTQRRRRIVIITPRDGGWVERTLISQGFGCERQRASHSLFSYDLYRYGPEQKGRAS